MMKDLTKTKMSFFYIRPQQQQLPPTSLSSQENPNPIEVTGAENQLNSSEVPFETHLTFSDVPVPAMSRIKKIAMAEELRKSAGPENNSASISKPIVRPRTGVDDLFFSDSETDDQIQIQSRAQEQEDLAPRILEPKNNSASISKPIVRPRTGVDDLFFSDSETDDQTQIQSSAQEQEDLDYRILGPENNSASVSKPIIHPNANTGIEDLFFSGLETGQTQIQSSAQEQEDLDYRTAIKESISDQFLIQNQEELDIQKAIKESLKDKYRKKPIIESDGDSNSDSEDSESDSDGFFHRTKKKVRPDSDNIENLEEVSTPVLEATTTTVTQPKRMVTFPTLPDFDPVTSTTTCVTRPDLMLEHGTFTADMLPRPISYYVEEGAKFDARVRAIGNRPGDRPPSTQSQPLQQCSVEPKPELNPESRLEPELEKKPLEMEPVADIDSRTIESSETEDKERLLEVPDQASVTTLVEKEIVDEITDEISSEAVVDENLIKIPNSTGALEQAMGELEDVDNGNNFDPVQELEELIRSSPEPLGISLKTAPELDQISDDMSENIETIFDRFHEEQTFHENLSPSGETFTETSGIIPEENHIELECALSDLDAWCEQMIASLPVEDPILLSSTSISDEEISSGDLSSAIEEDILELEALPLTSEARPLENSINENEILSGTEIPHLNERIKILHNFVSDRYIIDLSSSFQIACQKTCEIWFDKKLTEMAVSQEAFNTFQSKFLTQFSQKLTNGCSEAIETIPTQLYNYHFMKNFLLLHGRTTPYEAVVAFQQSLDVIYDRLLLLQRQGGVREMTAQFREMLIQRSGSNLPQQIGLYDPNNPILANFQNFCIKILLNHHLVDPTTCRELELKRGVTHEVLEAFNLIAHKFPGEINSSKHMAYHLLKGMWIDSLKQGFFLRPLDVAKKLNVVAMDGPSEVFQVCKDVSRIDFNDSLLLPLKLPATPYNFEEQLLLNYPGGLNDGKGVLHHFYDSKVLLQHKSIFTREGLISRTDTFPELLYINGYSSPMVKEKFLEACINNVIREKLHIESIDPSEIQNLVTRILTDLSHISNLTSEEHLSKIIIEKFLEPLNNSLKNSIKVHLERQGVDLPLDRIDNFIQDFLVLYHHQGILKHLSFSMENLFIPNAKRLTIYQEQLKIKINDRLLKGRLTGDLVDEHNRIDKVLDELGDIGMTHALLKNFWVVEADRFMFNYLTYGPIDIVPGSPSSRELMFFIENAYRVRNTIERMGYSNEYSEAVYDQSAVKKEIEHIKNLIANSDQPSFSDDEIVAVFANGPYKGFILPKRDLTLTTNVTTNLNKLDAR